MIMKIIEKLSADPVLKTIAFLALTIALLAIFLHFPFGAYKYSVNVITQLASTSCPEVPSTLQQIKEMTLDEVRSRSEQASNCINQTEEQIIAPWLWGSEAPITPWFGPLVNVVWLLVFVVLISLLAAKLFGKKNVSQ